MKNSKLMFCDQTLLVTVMLDVNKDLKPRNNLTLVPALNLVDHFAFVCGQRDSATTKPSMNGKDGGDAGEINFSIPDNPSYPECTGTSYNLTYPWRGGPGQGT